MLDLFVVGDLNTAAIVGSRDLANVHVYHSSFGDGLLCNRKRSKDQDAFARLARPFKLATGLAEPAIHEDRCATATNGPPSNGNLKVEQ